MDKYRPKTKRIFENHRITVEIEEPWILDKDPERAHKQWVSKLDSVVASIKRHVDDCLQVYSHWNSINICVHCESDPEPDPETGAPACCNKAVEDYEKRTQ